MSIPGLSLGFKWYVSRLCSGTHIIYKLSRHRSTINRTIPEICTENTVFVLQNLREFYMNTFTEFYLTYIKITCYWCSIYRSGLLQIKKKSFSLSWETVTRVFGNKTPKLYNTVQQKLKGGCQTGDTFGTILTLVLVLLGHPT